jgi:hypothetical protein
MSRDDIEHFPFVRYARPGIYRRRVRVRTSPAEATAEMEDEPHRYAITLRHDGQCITAVEGRALRTPWTGCRGAVELLQRLVGMALSADPQQVWRHVNGREQCTHLLDLAGLAVSHAARGIAERCYDAEVPCLDPAVPREAVLCRDGHEVLRWTLLRNAITAPPLFAGQDVAGLMPWAKSAFVDRDRFEAVWLLRRAVFVSGHRFFDMDRLVRASDTGHVGDACHVYRAGNAERALRVRGSTRDFSDPRAQPLV